MSRQEVESEKGECGSSNYLLNCLISATQDSLDKILELKKYQKSLGEA